MNTKILSIFAILLFIVVMQQTQATPPTRATTTTTRATTTTTRATTTTTRATTTRRTPTTTTRRPTVTPTCRPIPKCTEKNPKVCGRSRTGMCRRFVNTCQLQRENCPKGSPLLNWSSVPMTQCRNLRGNAAGRCTIVCPRRPLKCPAGGEKMCVRSRNRQQCRVVANACTLRNLNCQSKPRGNWSKTKMERCKDMCAGGAPKTCVCSKSG